MPGLAPCHLSFRRRRDQSTQRSEVHVVQRVAHDLTGAPAFRFRRLQQHRQIPESWIVDDALERPRPETAAADVFVTIDAAPTRIFRVVHVKDLQPIESNDALEFREGVAVAAFRGDVVPGREQMARIARRRGEAVQRPRRPGTPRSPRPATAVHATGPRTS